MGDGSHFHQTHGYYAHGVGELILSKLAANRERDWDFAEDALAAGLVDPEILVARASDLPVESELRISIASSLQAIAARLLGRAGN